MSVEVHNIYTEPEKTCPRCGGLLSLGMVLINVPRNCTERITYPYMEIGQSMHFECYVGLVIETKFNELQKEKK